MWWTVVRVGILAIGLVLMSAPPTSAKRPPKPPACPGGRFPLSGDALVPGGSVPDAISIDDTQVSIESGCPTATARRKLTRTQTVLHVRWSQCGSLVGPASLVVKLDAATCESLVGRFRARKAKIRRPLTASVEEPADAYGRASAPLPDNAMLVSQGDFDALRQRPDFRSLGKKTTADDKAALDALDAANTQTVTDFLGVNPQLADQYLGGTDPANPNVAPADLDDFAFTFTDDMGAPQTVITHGPHWRMAILADALRTYPTHPNQLRLYDEIYDGLANIDPALQGQYPTPDAASQYALADLVALNASLVSQTDVYLPLVPPAGGLPPPGHPASCAAEEGSGDGTDRSGTGSCLVHKANGVYLNKPWPLKFFATCTKAQGARGTCWDFATTGATELWVAKKYARWVNLSEQHMNFLYKHIWYPSWFGDNGWPPDAMFKIIDTGYTYPFEADWDYNQSLSRSIDTTVPTYHNSCVGYVGAESAFCSDTNHQGEVFCADFGLFRLCAAIGPTVGSSGFAPTVYSELWNGSNPSFSLGLIFWAVGIFQKPVILSIGVPASFGPDANGYVHYVGPHCPVTTSNGMSVCHPASGCECDGGGHSVLVTGLIDNTQLPAGAPAGSGGGYLIVKNSWGNCYGDAGYAYLPYDWVKAYSFGAEVVGDIN